MRRECERANDVGRAPLGMSDMRFSGLCVEECIEVVCFVEYWRTHRFAEREMGAPDEADFPFDFPSWVVAEVRNLPKNVRSAMEFIACSRNCRLNTYM